MKALQNILIYLSPVWISALIVSLSRFSEKIDGVKDTSFTIAWSIATLAAGLILGNLPNENPWVIKIRKSKGVIARVSIFLMSPTIYGLIHYVFAKIKDGSYLCQTYLTSLFFLSTILSVLFTVFLLILIAIKVHNDQ